MKHYRLTAPAIAWLLVTLFAVFLMPEMTENYYNFMTENKMNRLSGYIGAVVFGVTAIPIVLGSLLLILYLPLHVMFLRSFKD